jgi:hypothetical protein
MRLPAERKLLGPLVDDVGNMTSANCYVNGVAAAQTPDVERNIRVVTTISPGRLLARIMRLLEPIAAHRSTPQPPPLSLLLLPTFGIVSEASQ